MANDAVKRAADEGGRTGTPEAILEVAGMYEKGDDLPQSYADAAKWYRKVASVSPKAAVKLAVMMIDGTGVPQDYAQAMSLCRQAAQRFYAPGQFCVGHLYERGLGTPPDLKEAVKWYEQASNLGNRDADVSLAKMYWKGEGLRLDRAEAYIHFFRASRIQGPDVKPEARQLWNEMTQDDIKHVEKKLKDMRLDPQKVFAFMQTGAAPAAK